MHFSGRCKTHCGYRKRNPMKMEIATPAVWDQKPLRFRGTWKVLPGCKQDMEDVQLHRAPLPILSVASTKSKSPSARYLQQLLCRWCVRAFVCGADIIWRCSHLPNCIPSDCRHIPKPIGAVPPQLPRHGWAQILSLGQRIVCILQSCFVNLRQCNDTINVSS